MKAASTSSSPNKSDLTGVHEACNAWAPSIKPGKYSSMMSFVMSTQQCMARTNQEVISHLCSFVVLHKQTCMSRDCQKRWICSMVCILQNDQFSASASATCRSASFGTTNPQYITPRHHGWQATCVEYVGMARTSCVSGVCCWVP